MEQTDSLCISLIYQYLQRTNSDLLGQFKVKYRPQKTDVVLSEVFAKWEEEQTVRGFIYKHLKEVAPSLATEFWDTYISPIKLELLAGDIHGIYKILGQNREVKVKNNNRLGVRVKTYSKEEIERLEKALANKENLGALAKEMGRTNSSVTSKVNDLRRNAGLKKGKFSSEEVDRLKQALAEGEDYKSVAVALGRPAKTVHHKMYELTSNANRLLKNRKMTVEEDIYILDHIIPCLKCQPLSSSSFLSQSDWLTVAEGMGRKPSSVKTHWEKVLQPWLLQYSAGTTGLRIERMLTHLIAEKYDSHKGIEWSEILNKHKEFKGHTSRSLSQTFSKVRERARVTKKDVTLAEVAQYAAHKYRQGNEKKDSDAKIIHRDKILEYFKKKVTDFGIEVSV